MVKNEGYKNHKLRINQLFLLSLLFFLLSFVSRVFQRLIIHIGIIFVGLEPRLVEDIVDSLDNLLSSIGWIFLIYWISTRIIKAVSESNFISQAPEIITTESDDEEGVLIRAYYRQVLAQSKLGFFVGIASSIVGIFFIFYTYQRLDFNSENINLWAATVPGVVIEAVSALIIVQTNNSVNNARNAMVELRQKRRISEQIEQALRQVETIENEEVKSKVKSVIVLHFSGLTIEQDYLKDVLMQILSSSPISEKRTDGL